MRSTQPKDHARAPLAALQAFAAAARLASFKAAAQELFRTPSAISHQVRELEAALGVALFERGHRSVTLTPAGRDLGRTAGRAFAQLERAWRDARAAREPVLSLSMAPGFAATYVLPRLADLEARVPGWRLVLESTTDRADLARAGLNVAVRFGPRPRLARTGGWGARLLLADRAVVVGAPAWFNARGRLKAGFEGSTLLGLAQHPRLWATALREIGVEHRGHQILFDSGSALIEAAAQGAGLALSPASVLRAHLERGTLKAAPGVSFDNGWGYWLLTRGAGAARRPVEAVAEWLSEAVTGGRAKVRDELRVERPTHALTKR